MSIRNFQNLVCEIELISRSRVHSVCVTTSDLFISVLDPPSLRIIPFPTSVPSPSPRTPTTPLPRLSRFPSTLSLNQPNPPSMSRRGSGWEGLPGVNGAGGESEVVVMSDWDWLIGRDKQDGKPSPSTLHSWDSRLTGKD